MEYNRYELLAGCSGFMLFAHSFFHFASKWERFKSRVCPLIGLICHMGVNLNWVKRDHSLQKCGSLFTCDYVDMFQCCFLSGVHAIF